MEGKCHICGEVGPLTFEHIPPKKAFNNRPVISIPFNKAITLGPDVEAKGDIQQRGMGDYTLCRSCNNKTGAWYGRDFIDWCYQGMQILENSWGNPILYNLNYIFPLRIIKQILSMLLSSAHAGFTDANPELKQFILNKEKKYIDPKYNLYVYYYKAGVYRNTGLIINGEMKNKVTFESKITPMIEISYPPYGYIMTINNKAKDSRLADITHFTRYGYNDFKVAYLKLTALPTYLMFPGDYRDKKEIEDAGRKGKKLMQENNK